MIAMASLSRSAWTALGACAIALATLAAYSDSFRGPFVYDDIPSITGNASIRHLGDLKSVLLVPVNAGYTHEGRPLLNLSLAVNYALGGTNVVGYHVANLLIHLASALLVFGLVRRTLESFRREGDPTGASLVATAAALLWCLHPLQTEAVTYVIQRAESLVGLFYLVSFYCFARYAGGGRSVWAVLCVAATWAGLGAKELMVTAPVMILFYDRTFFAGSFPAAWTRRKTLYLGLAASWIPLILLLAANGGHRGVSSGFGTGISWSGYVLTQPEAICRYLKLVVWPSPLVFDYGPLQRSLGQSLPYLLVVLALGGASLWALARRPVLGFFGFWFFGILAVTSLLPGSTEMIVERRMYLPLLALAVLAAEGLRRLPRPLGQACGLTVCVALGWTTFARNAVYESDVNLWKDSVAQAPGNSRGWYNLGVAYFGHGQTDQEIDSYKVALQIDPNNAEAQHSLANALVRIGHSQDAVAHYDLAIALQPKNGRLRADAAAVLAQMGRWSEAIAQAHAALQLEPDDAKAHDTLGACLMQTGQVPSAVEELAAALQIDPTLVSAHANLGTLLASLGRLGEAQVELQKAVELNPALARAQYVLGNVLSQEGRFYEAINAYQAAAEAMGRSADFQGNLGLAYLQTGQPEKAVPLLEAVVRQRPASKEAHHNLAAAYSQVGRESDSKAQLEAEAASAGQ